MKPRYKVGNNAFEEMGEFWDKNSTEFRRGRKILEDWHEQCRLKRIEARIAERKKQNALKMVQIEQARLLKNLSETDSKSKPNKPTKSKQNRKAA